MPKPATRRRRAAHLSAPDPAAAALASPAPGATRELTVPRTGGWSYTVAVTFIDGSKDPFAGAVPTPDRL